MPYAPENIKDAPGHVVCLINRVVVLIWKQPPANGGIEDTRQIFRTAITRAPKERLAFLTLIEPAAMGLNVPSAVRDALAAMLREYQRHIVGAVVVVDAEGFRASIVRTFVATTNLANRLEFPSNTEKTLDAATQWLASRDAQLVLSATALTEAVRSLRKRFSDEGETRDAWSR